MQPDPSTFRTLYIFGAGGHGREVAWLAKRALPHGVDIRFLVDAGHDTDTAVDGIPVDRVEAAVFDESSRLVVAVGDPRLRQDVAARLRDRGALSTTIVHPGVEMSERVKLGLGAVVCAGCVITTNVQIGQHTHVNIGCTISHDVAIASFSTLSPAVHIAGNVQVGHRVFIGIGASIINGQVGSPLVIGDDAVVAAGACVTRAVEPGALVAGVPAVRKR